MNVRAGFWLGCATVVAMTAVNLSAHDFWLGTVELVSRTGDTVRDFRRRRRTLSDASRLQDADELVRRLADHRAVRRGARLQDVRAPRPGDGRRRHPAGNGRVPGRHAGRAADHRDDGGRVRRLLEGRRAGGRARRVAGTARRQPAREGTIFALCEAGAAHRARERGAPDAAGRRQSEGPRAGGQSHVTP